MSLYDKLKEAGTESMTWKIHTFTTTGNSTFAVTGSGDIEYLVVAGGGGASHSGGGAGGFRTNVSGATSGGGGSAEATYGVTAQDYTITVGAGGSGGSSPVTGSNSSIVPASGTSIISNGGGKGIGGNGGSNNPAGNGGSGGGSAYDNNTNTRRPSGQGTANQGYNGGQGWAQYSSGASGGNGGGGGAGGVGQNSPSNGSAGAGGSGLASSIQTGSAITYASGGSGSGNATGSANTGNGGGGATGSGGSGGSGIVIIRYVDDGSITATGGTVTTISESTPMKQRMVETFSGDGIDYNRWGASAGDFGFSMADDIDGGILLKWYNSSPANGQEGILTTSDTANGNKRQFSPTNFVWIANCKWTGTRTQGVSRFGIKRDKGLGFNGGGVAGATLGSDNAKISAYTTNETSGQISVVASTIDVDNVYHNYKGARSGGAYTLLIDGVTSVTETNGYLPVNASQPFLYCYNNDSSHHSLNCNYFEVYNT